MPLVGAVVRALKKSLEKPFSGIFRRIRMEEEDPDEPFSHRIYFLATMLDPQFGLTWVDLDVQNGEAGPALKRFRDDLKKSLTGDYIIIYCYCCCCNYYYCYFCFYILIRSIMSNPVSFVCVHFFLQTF